ncbi:hypothetical protein [Actinomycetospora sp.]|jgi:hypothetical protein|uniref:hypothetical protein n=1 Tax=Actinomycetospora sp. TaxID=1872135 RepID=UPI002F42E0C4
MSASAPATMGYRPPAGHVIPAQPIVRGNVAVLDSHEKSRLTAAAHHARRVYPGTVGELVDRELRAYAESGHGLAGDGLALRLAREILALPVSAPAPREPVDPTRGARAAPDRHPTTGKRIVTATPPA